VLLDVASYLGKEPFANPSISRALTLEDMKIILDSVSVRNQLIDSAPAHVCCAEFLCRWSVPAFASGNQRSEIEFSFGGRAWTNGQVTCTGLLSI